MLFPSLPLFGFARSGVGPLPGLLTQPSTAELPAFNLSISTSTVLIGVAILVVYAVLRRLR